MIATISQRAPHAADSFGFDREERIAAVLTPTRTLVAGESRIRFCPGDRRHRSSGLNPEASKLPVKAGRSGNDARLADPG